MTSVQVSDRTDPLVEAETDVVAQEVSDSPETAPVVDVEKAKSAEAAQPVDIEPKDSVKEPSTVKADETASVATEDSVEISEKDEPEQIARPAVEGEKPSDSCPETVEKGEEETPEPVERKEKAEEITTSDEKAVESHETVESAEEKEVVETVQKPSLAPLPFVISRSFQMKPRQQQAYPMNRSLSFDSKKTKKAAAKNKDDAADKEGASLKGGIPLLRRLSFRGRKEMKAQQKEVKENKDEADEAATPSDSASVTRSMKPPLPKASAAKPPLPTKPASAEEAKPKQSNEVISKNVSKDVIEPTFEEEKKETDKEAATTTSIFQNESLISTRSAATESHVTTDEASILQQYSSKAQSVADETAEVADPVESKDVEKSMSSISKAQSGTLEKKSLVVDAVRSTEAKVSDEALAESLASKAVGATEVETEADETITKNSGKEDASKDGTETTEGDGDILREEKEGLVVTSSASEVEVTAGSGFFGGKFCCGLTLATAGST